MSQLPNVLAAPRAIVLVSVEWSPGPKKSRQMLAALEDSREIWLPASVVEFFDLRPEHDEELNRWYERQCREESAGFALHGDGYGPF